LKLKVRMPKAISADYGYDYVCAEKFQSYFYFDSEFKIHKVYLHF